MKDKETVVCKEYIFNKLKQFSSTGLPVGEKKEIMKELSQTYGINISWPTLRKYILEIYPMIHSGQEYIPSDFSQKKENKGGSEEKKKNIKEYVFKKITKLGNTLNNFGVKTKLKNDIFLKFDSNICYATLALYIKEAKEAVDKISENNTGGDIAGGSMATRFSGDFIHTRSWQQAFYMSEVSQYKCKIMRYDPEMNMFFFANNTLTEKAYDEYNDSDIKYIFINFRTFRNEWNPESI